MRLQATICDVAVHPDYRQKGIGRKIVKKLVQVSCPMEIFR